MTSWKGQSRGGLLGYKIFIYSLKFLGLPFAYFILRFVAFYFFLFSPKSVKYTYFYFHKIQNYSSTKSIIKIYRNFYVFGQILLDKIALMAGFTKRLTFNFEGEEYLRKMVTEKTGGLLISAHIGNFETAGYLLKRLNAKINIIMLDAEHQRIKSYLSSFISFGEINIIPIKEDLSHIYAIDKALENKEIVCLHADRYIEGSKTIELPFFNYPAQFPIGPFYLALRYNTPISFVFAMKEKKYHYHFYASEGKIIDSTKIGYKEKEGVLKNTVQEYVGEVERFLQQYPEQWFNYYNFWEAIKQ